MLRRSVAILLLLAVVMACSLFSPPAATPPSEKDSPGTGTPDVPQPTPTRHSVVTPTPLVVEPDPALDLEAFAPGEPFTLRFNQTMNPTSAAHALLTYPWTPGEMRWDSEYTRLTFLPHQGFTPDRTYQISINPALRGASGAAFDQAPQWNITVLPAPQVLSHQPATARIYTRRPAIELTFDRPMDSTSLADALLVQPAVDFGLDFQGEKVLITLSQALDPGQRYHFTLSGTARDQQGVSLGDDYRWDYTLPDLVSSIEGPNYHIPSQALILNFNFPLDVQSLADILTVSTPDQDDLSGEWMSAGDTKITFRPTTGFQTNTVYTVQFSGPLLDANGDLLSPPDPLTYTTPPPILSYGPSEGEVVDTTPEIYIEFAAAVDRESTQSAFGVAPELPGEFYWRDNTLVFQPSSPLESYRQYTVTLESSATHANGDRFLLEPFSWNFMTGYVIELGEYLRLSFGEYGPNAQVLDYNGRRAVQFVASPDLHSVEFELYRLTLDQFLERYSSGFRGVAERESTPISTIGAALQKTWQEQLEGPGQGWDDNIYETTIPGDIPAGLYLLNMWAEGMNDQLILVLTRNTLMAKQVEGQLVAWVTDINGGIRPNVRIGVYARDGVLLSEGRADDSGVFRTRVNRDPQPLIVVAQDNKQLTGREIEGTDITVSGLSNEWQASRGRWGFWWQPAPKSKKHAVYIYTDRPIYRPGQTVFYKAIIRQDEDADLSLLPEGTPVTARIRDVRDNLVQTYDLATNAFGSVAGEFSLAEGAMLGNYNVEIVIGGESHRQAFKVQDYRKPDYQVSVTSDTPQYISGDTINVAIDTQYFFGLPVANAQVTLKQYMLREYYSYWWVEDSLDQPDYDWYPIYGKEFSGRTNSDGRYTLELQAGMETDEYSGYHGWGSSLTRQTFGVEATVDDGSRQTVSAFTVYHVYNQPEQIDLDAGSWIQVPGQSFTVRGGVTTIADEPVSGRDLRLELSQYDKNTRDYDRVIQSVDLVSDVDGKINTPLTIDATGFYQLRLSTILSDGSTIFNRRYVYAIDPDRPWYSDYIQDFKISADKESYTPGDAAHLVIESNFGGPALLTFERATSRRSIPVELTPPLTLTEVPIRADDAPNIFVTVNAWQPDSSQLSAETYFSLKDSNLRTATVELKVPIIDKILSVAISSDHESYAPKDEATFSIRVTDKDGLPIVAELSLALVDEAIFSLSEDLSGPIYDAFYFNRKNLVRTYNSMALERELLAPGLGGGGGDEGPGNPRSDFPDTAAWIPVLHTDENGEATVKLSLPDSLTTWRLTVKAVSTDNKVGENISKIVTQQEIVVRPILPRSVTVGDQVYLSAMVHNYSPESRQLATAISVESLDQELYQLPLAIQGPITQTISLDSGQAGLVVWPAEALAAGEAVITVWAVPPPDENADRSGDAIQFILPVHPLAVPDVTTQVGEYTGALEIGLLLPDSALDISTVHLELSRSIAGSLLTGLEYLTGFPYGCVEQTMSRALPNAVIGRAFHQLGLGNPTLQADLPPKINAGLQRLYGYQHNDGGWGWWFDDRSDAYQTAWVVFGLSVTAEAGYDVDMQVIERGADWLIANLSEMELRTQAYVLYSLANAGFGDLEATLTLLPQVNDLDTFSRAGLALALHALGADEEARSILDLLAESAVQRDGMVYWPNPHEDGHYFQKTMASSVRSTALALDAFVRIRPGHALETGIVRWLMSQRGQDGWGSTNETSYTILALSDHLLTLEEKTSEYPYEIFLNGESLASGTLDRTEPAVSLDVPVFALDSGANLLNVQGHGDVKLFYTLTSRMYFPQADIPPAGGIEINRRYLKPETREPVTSVIAGELVEVELSIDLPDKGFFMILEDPLPGGLEALNESLNTTSHEQVLFYEEGPPTFWQEFGYNQKEVWGDRVTFFITEMEAGKRSFSYLARATHSGTFTALPAQAEAMYDPTLWGRSASDTFIIQSTP